MKRNFFIGFTVIAVLFGLLVLLALTFLEGYQRSIQSPPSAQARINQYLALDRWLAEMGHPVRVLRSGTLDTLRQAEERQIFLQASLFRWTPQAIDYLSGSRWIERGGYLFIALDYHNEWELRENSSLMSLLDDFGITVLAEQGRPSLGEGTPDFTHGFHFEAPPGAFTVDDRSGITRLAQVRRGSGSLIVSAQPRFLLSEHIGSAPNADLALELFTANAAPGIEEGWLFIRGAPRAAGLLGTLFRHGNLAALIASALVLIVIGFWAVIPLFGLVRGDDERQGKPLRERFAAEGRFFKRYGALGFYRDIYIKEIRRHFARKEGITNDEEITRRVSGILGKSGGQRLFASALAGKPVIFREFPRMINTFRTILERI